MSVSSNQILEALLANTFVLSLKTKNFHWNITGPHFYSYHQMLESQYDDLDDAIDVIAEAIRQQGAMAPGSLAAMQSLATLKCHEGEASAQQMLQLLLGDHQHIIDQINAALADGANALGAGVEDYLSDRLVSHQKMHWMLAASLA